MKREMNLRDMNPTQALCYCINICSKIWQNLESRDAYFLWGVILNFLQNGYEEINVVVPKQIYPVWEKCRVRIEKELALC